jgi:hypothetical protein
MLGTGIDREEPLYCRVPPFEKGGSGGIFLSQALLHYVEYLVQDCVCFEQDLTIVETYYQQTST